MIRFIGFIIIVASCTKIGIDLSQKYCKRTKEIKSFVYLLERIKSEISFSNCTVTDALKKYTDSKNNVISNMLCCILDSVNEKSVTLEEAYNNYIENNENLSFFKKKDVEEIGRFFTTFGIGDRDDEIEKINNAIYNMTLYFQEAMDDEKKYVKLFRTSGVLAGFLIAIILA